VTVKATVKEWGVVQSALLPEFDVKDDQGNVVNWGRDEHPPDGSPLGRMSRHVVRDDRVARTMSRMRTMSAHCSSPPPN